MGHGGSAFVVVDARRRLLEPGQVLTFGRSASCDIQIGPRDNGGSRLAGQVAVEGGTIWVTNTSETRHFGIVDQVGFRHALGPGQRHAVTEAPAEIVVEGSAGRYALLVGLERPPAPVRTVRPVDDDDGERRTEAGSDVRLNERDRLALVALFEGYLLPFPRHSPHPATYSAAADLLGWPRTTLLRRVEYIRRRLTAAGVPNLVGENALTYLAEYVLASRLITRDDLALLADHRRSGALAGDD